MPLNYFPAVRHRTLNWRPRHPAALSVALHSHSLMAELRSFRPLQTRPSRGGLQSRHGRNAAGGSDQKNSKLCQPAFAEARFPQAPHRCHPAEDLLGPFSPALTDCVAVVARRSAMELLAREVRKQIISGLGPTTRSSFALENDAVALTSQVGTCSGHVSTAWHVGLEAGGCA